MESPVSRRKSSHFLWALEIRILFGAVVIAAVEFPEVPRGLGNGRLVLGGVLMGLLSPVIDEKLRTGPERRNSREQLDQMQAEMSTPAEQRRRLPTRANYHRLRVLLSYWTRLAP